MSYGKGRWAAALLLGLSFELGCALDRDLGALLAQPVQRRDDVGARRAYETGYEAGRRDDQRELRADYTRYERSYDRSTERAFAAGYRDGYGGGSDRYGSPATRSWSDEDDDDRGRVSRAVPEWLVGDYRGWNEAYESDVALSVQPNAAVVLVADGRQRQGVYRDGRVHFRNAAYAITRVRDGIRFTRVDDVRNTVYLRRTD